MSAARGGAQGSREIGFTVLSMSISLVAVFIPLLFMGGIVGRLFREFAVTLSVAIAISLVVSLTTTPDAVREAAAQRARPDARQALPVRWNARSSGLLSRTTTGACGGCCGTGPLMLASCSSPSALNWYLFSIVPKGFFPQQDNGD